MTFTTGIIIGAIASCISFSVAMYTDFNRSRGEIKDAYNKGFESGREWKDYEIERAETMLEELREEIGELKSEKLEM